MTATKLFPFVIIFIGLGNNHSDILGTVMLYNGNKGKRNMSDNVFELAIKTYVKIGF